MEERERRIIIGLGNPGNRYTDTRHNLGFWFVDYLAHRWNFPLFDQGEYLLISRGTFRGVDVVIMKPTTFMNRSALALVSLSNLLEFKVSDLLVCHDDLDIEVGRFKLKGAGGSGGHKGVISIHDYLCVEDIARLKFGIMPAEKPWDVESFVLSPFEPDEESEVVDLFPVAAEAVECFLVEGIDKAMSLYNRNMSEPTDQEV